MELEKGAKFKPKDPNSFVREAEVLEIEKSSDRAFIELRTWGEGGRLHRWREWWNLGVIRIALEIGSLVRVKESLKRPLVIIESPYAGDVERNLEYARRAVRDSLDRGESPIASHLLYTQDGILDDTIPEERALGIDAGLAWKRVADKHVFYVDLGYSPGMTYARNSSQLPVEERRILNAPKP